MEQLELAKLHQRADEALSEIPEVVCVGFGLKEVGGISTDVVALRVYVKVKKPLNELPPELVIPTEFEGFPTDVLLIPEVEPPTPADTQLACQDFEEHPALIGGITIINALGSPGTLGFFATINGEDDRRDNVVMVSNHHVIGDISPKVGEPIYQPAMMLGPDGHKLEYKDPGRKNLVATIHKLGMEGVYPFTFESGEPEFKPYIDCATARLDIRVSSCCNTNCCGTTYRNEINGLSLNGSSKIASVARMAHKDIGTDNAIVYKVGRSTGRSKGRVIDILGPRNGPGRVMVIEGIEGCKNSKAFGDRGDSGAAIVNEKRQLVGLLVARSGINKDHAFACHIHPVLAYLDITAITEENPPKPPAGQALSAPQSLFAAENSQAIPLRNRFVATPQGSRFHDLVLEHHLEVLDLVNHHRPVTVAWHRGNGPAFLNRAIHHARDPSVPLPREIDGVSRRSLLERMREALLQHGSENLRTAIAAHGEQILTMADSFDDLRELAERFENETAFDGKADA